MNLDRFVRERTPHWNDLASLLDRAGGRPERLDATSLMRLASLYRSAAADLALVRRRWPHDAAASYLQDLVTRGRSVVYDAEPRMWSLREFVARGYWRRITERAHLLGVAAICLLVPGLIAGLWGIADPDAATRFVPAAFRQVADLGDPESDLGLSAAEQAAFSSLISTNNIQVSFLAFAAGIGAGVGTALLLVYNGSLLGAVAGLAVDAGNGDSFMSLVAAHGVLELSCIVVAGAAGLRIGWALVSPGPQSRGTALVSEGRAAVEVILGTALWLVVAALIEGFLTPKGLGALPALAVGTGVGGLYWLLVATRGRGVTDEPGA